MRKVLPVLAAALVASSAFAQVDISSPGGNWTVTLGAVLADNSLGVPPSGQNGQFVNLRAQNGADNLWETIFYEATSTNGNLTQRIEDNYTQTIEDIGANSATFRLVRNDSLLQLDVDVLMIDGSDGSDGGALVELRWTNIGSAAIDVKPVVYADLDVDGDFDNNTSRWLMGTQAIQQTQLSTNAHRWFGVTGAPYTAWEIAGAWPGMRTSLDDGRSELDSCCDQDVPDDYTSAISGETVTLQPGEMRAFSFALGGNGISGGGCDEPCDMNCDGVINAFDIEPFLDLLFDPNATPCDTCTGDANGDGTVDAFDIEPFLACLFP